jgi:hypothetical protein
VMLHSRLRYRPAWSSRRNVSMNRSSSSARTRRTDKVLWPRRTPAGPLRRCGATQSALVDPEHSPRYVGVRHVLVFWTTRSRPSRQHIPTIAYLLKGGRRIHRRHGLDRPDQWTVTSSCPGWRRAATRDNLWLSSTPASATPRRFARGPPRRS